jgi:tetratricopeptide (TPR) repeat protein
VKTFLIPVGLTPIYPKWPITATDLIPWLALLGWPIVLTLLVKWRDRLPTLCVWGVAQFLISLLPIVGLAPFNYQAQSYVGDHFLYLSCIGGGLALASCAEAVVQRRRQPARVLALALTVVLVATYAILTHLYSRHWRTNHAFWTHAYESNPNNYWANTELGMLYEAKGDLQQAIGFYRRAVDLFADNAMAFSRYLLAVARLHGAQAAVDSCNRKLAENPPYAGTVHVLRGLMYERLGNKAAAAEDYDAGLRLSRPGSQTWRTARRRLRVLRSP